MLNYLPPFILPFHESASLMADQEQDQQRIERRVQDPYLVLMNTILNKTEQFQQTATKVEVLSEQLKAHVQSNEEFQEFMQRAVKDAFLDGDLLLHREEHKELRARSRLCRSFFENLLEKLGQGTVFGLLSVLAALVLYWWHGQVPPKP